MTALTPFPIDACEITPQAAIDLAVAVRGSLLRMGVADLEDMTGLLRAFGREMTAELRGATSRQAIPAYEERCRRMARRVCGVLGEAPYRQACLALGWRRAPAADAVRHTIATRVIEGLFARLGTESGLSLEARLDLLVWVQAALCLGKGLGAPQETRGPAGR